MPKKNFKEIINTFTPIDLKNMGGVSLMDRMDEKFIVPLESINDILQKASNDYFMLDIDNKRLLQYETLYYDTPEQDLYFSHHAGKANRYKIRHRTYVDSELSFFEIKFKNNKGRTLKKRIKVPQQPQEKLYGLNEEFVKNNSCLSITNNLESNIWVNYNRITLVSKQAQERVTLDFDLTFIKNNNIEKYASMVVVEIKQDKIAESAFKNILRAMHFRAGGISKYCLGVISLNNDIKHNAFKPTLHKLKHLSA